MGTCCSILIVRFSMCSQHVSYYLTMIEISGFSGEPTASCCYDWLSPTPRNLRSYLWFQLRIDYNKTIITAAKIDLHVSLIMVAVDPMGLKPWREWRR